MMLSSVKPIDELKIFQQLKSHMSGVVFITAVVFGFLTYGFSMSNGYVNGDGLTYGFYYNVGAWDIGQGRWALPFFSGRFLTSWFEGTMSILSLAAAAVFVVRFFEITSISASIIISMLVATQTHFAQWQGSPYILFPYSAGFLSAVVGAYMMWNGIQHKKWGLSILSSGLLAFSLGIYQAYLPIAMCMLYLKLMIEVMHNRSRKEILVSVIKIGVFLGVAGIMYMVFLKVAMAYYHIDPVEARGWGDLLSGKVAFFHDPVATIKSVYKIFVQLLFIDGMISFSRWHKIVYLIVVVADGYFFVRYVIENKMRAIVVAGGVLLFPMMAMTIRLLTDKVIPWSMYPTMLLVPIFCVVFCAEGIGIKDRGNMHSTLQWIVIFCMIYLSFESMYIANVDYINLQKRNLKMQTACTRILDRIETVDEYYQDIPIVFYGALQNTYSNPLSQYEEKLKGYEAYIMDWLPYKSSSFLYARYITNYLGVYINTPSNYADIINEVEALEEFRNVNSFPAMDCIYMYKGVLVVKLSDSK